MRVPDTYTDKMNMSVCIPVYNNDVNALIQNLLKEFIECRIAYEILLIDDASRPEFQEKNKKLSCLENVKYIELPENIGRAAIRNMFLQYAQYENMLFLDSDSVITTPLFIRNYLSAMQNTSADNCSVICGGTAYDKEKPSKSHRLRWKYGMEREAKSSRKRSLKPYQSFSSNNFLVKKTVLQKVKFEEKLRHYGHEDSLFAYRLMLQNAALLHIENPTLHHYDETTGVFLKKTNQAIDNLIFINKKIVPDGGFIRINRLLTTYFKIKKTGTLSIFKIFSLILNPFLLFLLKHGTVNLKIFDTYKLFYLIKKY